MTTLTPAQAHLLQAAFAADESGAVGWRRWRDGIDWNANLRRDEFRLMPAVARNLKRMRVEEPLVPRFTGIARQAWYANQRSLRAILPVLRALARAGVRVAPLPPHWLLLHDASAVFDHDAPFACALPPSSVDAATRSLWHAGWRPVVPLPRWMLDGRARVEGELAWHDGQGRLLALAWPRVDAARDDPWTQAGEARLANEPVLALATADAIAHVFRRPPAEPSFTAAVDLLLHLDVTARNDTGHDFHPVAHAPVDAGWARIVDELATVLPGQPALEALCRALDGAAIVPARASPASFAPTRGRLRERVAAHWNEYRRTWASDFTWAAAVRQLPGYLMAKWRLSTPRQLPMRAWRGLRYDWRDSRRPAPGRGESADG